MSDRDKKFNKQINFYLGKGAKNKKDQREIDKQMKVADADTAAKAQAEKDEQDDFDKRTSSKVKNLVTSADKELQSRKKKESMQAQIDSWLQLRTCQIRKNLKLSRQQQYLRNQKKKNQKNRNLRDLI